jgi:predicted Fe-Mo cluster-binding NifX family protein
MYITPNLISGISVAFGCPKSNRNGVFTMSKVAVMMSANRADAQLSAHFGKAEWLMIADTEARVFGFQQNEGANGKSVVEMLTGLDCTDVIFTEIGEGARQQLQARQIRGWIAPPQINAQQALQMLEHRRLRLAISSTDHGGSCGCASEAEPKKCCGGCK